MIQTAPFARASARLLGGIREGRVSLADHRSRYLQPPAPTTQPRRELIAVIEASGLRGRGGAGFPTARKLQAVADQPGRRIVVANGTEGEPVSLKDTTLLRTQPNLVLDGAVLAASAVGAGRLVIAVSRRQREALDSIRAALAERRHEGVPCPIELVETPPRYVAGEESALVHWLNGGPAKPTSVPPRPFERGIKGRPTLVQNVETLAHLTQIATHGADWFRRVGESEEPGTMLVTISGVAQAASVIEAAVGTPIAELITRAGGAPDQLHAVLVGGFFGTWLAAESLDLAFSRPGLARQGASPGAGVLIGLRKDACPLRETARLLTWFASESSGQCGPCVFGLDAIARASRQLADGFLPPSDAERLQRLRREITGRGACQHPNGAVRLLTSVLEVFAEDVERHLNSKPCPAGPSVIGVPTVNTGWR